MAVARISLDSVFAMLQQCFLQTIARGLLRRLNSLFHVGGNLGGSLFYVLLQVASGHHKASSRAIRAKHESWSRPDRATA